MNKRASMLLAFMLTAASGLAQGLPGAAGDHGQVVYGRSGISPEAARAKPFPATLTTPTADFPGKKVSLKAQGVSLREAFDSLREQSGVKFSIPGNKPLEDKTITLEMQDKPLWQALQALLKQADPSPSLACVVRAPGAGTVIRVNSSLSSSGAFLVSINRVSQHVSAGPGQPQTYNVSTSVMCDGTLRLSGVQYESTAQKATDERGDSLVSSLAITPRFVPTDRGTFSYPAIIILQAPATGDLPRKIALLEGVLPALYVTTEDVEVKMGEKVERRYGQWVAAISLLPRRGSPGEAQVLLRYTPDATVTDAQIADWQQQVNAAGLELFDTEGKSLPLGLGNTGLARRVIWISENYPPQPASGRLPQTPAPTGKPGKVIVHVPTAFKTVEIPYRFEDVQLP